MKPTDLDDARDYANHRDHCRAQCKNGDRLILALVAELRAARTERDQLSHDASEARRKLGMAQATNISLMAELRAARKVVEIARHADAPGLRAAIHAYDYAMRDED